VCEKRETQILNVLVLLKKRIKNASSLWNNVVGNYLHVIYITICWKEGDDNSVVKKLKFYNNFQKPSKLSSFF
jgi:hypothetical protein